MSGDEAMESEHADAAMRSISRSPSLRALRLNESGVTDAGILELEKLTELSNLSIYQENRLTGRRRCISSKTSAAQEPASGQVTSVRGSGK